jgi:putative toxin-antitoxin system antitoxin component (TIGR02293 family)
MCHVATLSAYELTETQVRNGVPVTVVAQLTAELGIGTPALLAWLQVAPRTWARRKQTGRFDMLESDRLARLGRLIRRARKVLGGSAEARTWMTVGNRALGGRTPFEVAGTEVGAEAVFDLLGRLEHGVFS